MDELTPIFRALTQNPIPFVGGFVAGVLRLNATEDPVKSWLVEQSGKPTSSFSNNRTGNGNNGSGPQTIAIE
jgi:hypothetical protein